VSHLRLRLLVAVAALLAFASIGGAKAASTELFISEYIEGSSNNKAIEIYNGTGASIDLAANAYAVQMFFNGSSIPGLTINLSGTVAAGDVFVLAQASASAAILARADQTSGAGWFNGDDAIALRKGTNVVDTVGQIGFDPGTEWGTGLTSTADNTLRRKSAIQAGDTNGADAFDPGVEWDGFAVDTFAGLGSHTVDGGGPTDPTGVGSATPSSVLPGGNTVLTVAVTPGTNPESTGITVTGDLSQIGGSATQAFFDDGTNGDATAGNNVFSYGATVSAATTSGAKSLPVGIADAQARSGAATIALTVAEPPPPAIEISEIQGAAHISPRNGQRVSTTGIVIGKFGSSFYIQDATADANPDTSEGLQVFGATAAAGVAVGDEVSVVGRVTEFRASGTSLTVTELTSPAVTVLSTGNPLPSPTVIGSGGRIPPNTVIEDDATGNVETSGVFDPATDGLDFYESMEGMLVQMNDLVATSFTFTNFGEVFVVGDNGANATTMTPRGGLVISPGDLNPERMVIDDEWFKTGSPAMPAVNVGGTFPGAHVGIMDWAFGEYRIQLREKPTVGSTGVSFRESTVAAGADQVSIATFNVENLAGNEADAKYNILAGMIVNNLAAPDIVSLEEIQDNNGATNDSVVDANVTLDRLVAAIAAAGGPAYSYRQINPVDDRDGGQPGGNIRVGFLFRSDRGLAFVDRPGGDATTPVAVVAGPNGPELSLSPGRVEPGNSAWTSSRKPLAAEFTYNGHKLFVITNHFNSKGGDQGLFGPQQPPVLSSEVQRIQQAALVAKFVSDILALDPTANVAVVGDLNDFQFSPPLRKLKDVGLTALIETLPPAERYSYVFDGNSQALDHILVSGNLLDNAAAADGYDIVHVNSEFIDQASDHDPQLVQLTMPKPTIAASTAPAANAAGWNNAAVTVSFTCVDPLSALVGACPTPVTLSSEGANQSVSRSVTTEGGLTLSAGDPDIDIDLTNPTVTYTGGHATYDVDETISITCTPSDTLSGIASSTCANISGPATSFALGAHTFSASALDRAGNTGSGSVSFTVVVSYDGLCRLTRSYVDDADVADSLCAQLAAAKAAAARGNDKAKNSALNAYSKLLNSQIGKSVTAAEAATLAELAKAL
jgi:predicted extracellular nuclease